MDRVIGIVHRVKKTRDQEARPTMAAIQEEDNVRVLELATETDEYDFSKARFPVAWRKVAKDEDVSGFLPHQCKWRKVKRDEDVSELNPNHLRRVLDKKTKLPLTEQIVKVPVEFDGLRPGDKVAMMLGGSGDIFAGRLSIEGDKIGAEVYRIPPFVFSDQRLPDEKDKKSDHLALLRVFGNFPNLFYLIRPPDRALIRVKAKLLQRQEAQRQRIKRQQQIWHSLIGRVFMDETGNYGELEGELEDVYQKAQDDDEILKNLWEQEKEAEKALKRAVHPLMVWDRIFSKIEGCGERIAAGIIASIADIRRFIAHNGEAKLKKFCGVHVMEDGRFPRQRHGEPGEGTPEARQALYLLADQFNRKPDSVWGKKLLQYKLALREKHPEPVEVESSANGDSKKKKVKRYTNGHIHRMAKWRTLTRFVERLYKDWVAIENEKSAV